MLISNGGIQLKGGNNLEERLSSSTDFTKYIPNKGLLVHQQILSFYKASMMKNLLLENVPVFLSPLSKNQALKD